MTESLEGKVEQVGKGLAEATRKVAGQEAFEPPAGEVGQTLKKLGNTVDKEAQDSIEMSPIFPGEEKPVEKLEKNGEEKNKVTSKDGEKVITDKKSGKGEAENSVKEGAKNSLDNVSPRDGEKNSQKSGEDRIFPDDLKRDDSIKDKLDDLFDKFPKKFPENSFKPGILLDEVTEKDRARAKDILENDIDPVASEADRKSLTAMQQALIDGDMKSFAKAVQDADPKRLDNLVKSLDKSLNRNENSGGVDVKKVGEDVYLYEENGGTAIKINSKTGETSILPIEHQKDGSIVAKEGTIINRTAEDVMKDAGEEAARSLTTKMWQHLKPSYKEGLKEELKKIPLEERGLPPVESNKWFDRHGNPELNPFKGGKSGGDKLGNPFKFLEKNVSPAQPGNYYEQNIPGSLK